MSAAAASSKPTQKKPKPSPCFACGDAPDVDPTIRPYRVLESGKHRLCHLCHICVWIYSSFTTVRPMPLPPT